MIKNQIIPALDVQDKERFDFLIKELRNDAKIVKIGMELYYTYGNDIVKQVKDYGLKVFLDLKLHDIPNTVHRGCKTLAKNGVDILNVHAGGGIEMMRAGLEGFLEHNSNGILIGVTQLTSTDQQTLNQQLLIPGVLPEAVLSYARNTKEAGLAGVVCSALEVTMIKKHLGDDFKCITPGIRPKGSTSHDQKRVMTPKEAITVGSDYLVIGRAITNADSPKTAFQNIIKDITNE